MFLKQFNEILEKGAIPIGQSDKLGKSLRQFDEIQYKDETYLIVWHPMYNEFVGSHESQDWISHTDLHKAVWIKNLKDYFFLEISSKMKVTIE
ncbi:hypothetical protein BK727_07610 [Bacillus thuringiensis serovar roskildiensis]|uniref:Uncharacterized protein n=1 Tax=Bacillus thuringiensis serovar sooncheon TaxID=180891 RepID=A0A9Q5SLI3_BACTU|nr:hypothetical protein [Bacillus thuringiensis]MEB9661366.1 hypothetical protein [Bacillus cereus]ARV91357.1 hypothetical protein BJG91_01495 [Bacillus thuringiensis]OTW70689.1 hypothetical protein BK707_11345 [Bacillus thuringiensis serovar coreanensis]OTX51000.1 hypothetical protein BK724_05375 [Bacillus thuringiensis serovar sooncheon]OTX56826.1 hypothetical protein BK725_08465 [Bacillus thuringiensis serovar guiyangiensis]